METSSDQIMVDHDAWKVHPGPLLLLAGPGTGKTHQLALRIKDLVENRGVDPTGITVITFTREAALNMRDRLSDETRSEVYLRPELRPGRIATMHSLGLEIIREYAEFLKLPTDFAMLTNPLLRDLLFLDAALLQGKGLEEAKDASLKRQKAETVDPSSIDGVIIGQYEKILRENHVIDFDDQIILACHVLQSNADALKKFSSSATHLLVDEYQDIHPLQKKMIVFLSSSNPAGLFVVGDDDQSIYSFRGGSPEYVRNFRNHFDDAKVLSLQLSRRCPNSVLHGAIDVVKAFDSTRAEKPKPKFLKEKESDEKIVLHNVATEYQEAEIIAAIAAETAKRQQKLLVLVPARRYAEPIKRTLRARRLSFDHVPDVADWGLSMLMSIDDWIRSAEDNLGLRLTIHYIIESGALGIPSRKARSAEAKAKRRQAMSKIAALWQEPGGGSLWSTLGKMAKKDKLLEDLYDRLTALRSAKDKSLSSFLSTFTEDLRPWPSYENLTNEVRLALEELGTLLPSGGSDVRIMSLQGAKGLEAGIVCVVGFTEGIIPRSASKERLPEEARLAYVSMSRASGQLHLFHARKREASTTYLKKSYDLKPSRFASAINDVRMEQQYHAAPSKKKKRWKK